ncbi:MAG: DNA endonuclease [Bacillota bacterium]|nr:DNA endonuclease [Bacillota bacterium]
MEFNLTKVQFNVLIASIIGDGEITKIHPKSRRRNNSYREHYGTEQKDYREWKISFLPELLYITPKSNSVRSASLPLFTQLFPYFYFNKTKILPIQLLQWCSLPHFLSILYMDDGSLSIPHRINHKNKKIYLLPHIYLYLQCYKESELIILKEHIFSTFGIVFNLSRRKDGHGFVLKTTSVKETFNFLNIIFPVTQNCSSMFYKTNWNYRFDLEKNKWNKKYPCYEIIESSSYRNKKYTEAEIKSLLNYKMNGLADKKIAEKLNRSYWSVVYKIRELKDMKLL